LRLDFSLRILTRSRHLSRACFPARR
jgi:hypothetical protein